MIPKLSVVVIVYDMPAQAMTTLRSLAPAYQGAAPGDYEVLVVENRSRRCLDPGAVAALGPTFRYLLRDEPGVSPAAAINAGLRLARAPTVGLMIDGARMLTPGVIRHALMAQRITEGALVAVPGYQLGPAMQHLLEGRTEEDDRALLASIAWPAEGYRLFEIASNSDANRHGWFRPFMECNCLFAPRAVLDDIGGADERFDLPGGGALNLWLWHRCAHHPATTLFVLPGEGSFHQLHGGVSTTPRPDREALMGAILAQLNGLLGQPFASPAVEPILLGRVPIEAHPFATHAAERLANLAARLAKQRRRGAALAAQPERTAP